VLVVEISCHAFPSLAEQLSRMSKPERQGVGGFASSDDVPWGWFGSMFGAGVFKKLVNANSPGLSRALDAIPMRGEVRRDEYRQFIDAYVGAYPGRRRHGLATATRLLAMKRPDYFVCFDSENRDGLCRTYGIRSAITTTSDIGIRSLSAFSFPSGGSHHGRRAPRADLCFRVQLATRRDVTVIHKRPYVRFPGLSVFDEADFSCRSVNNAFAEGPANQAYFC
jgi:hypothetical protein